MPVGNAHVGRASPPLSGSIVRDLRIEEARRATSGGRALGRTVPLGHIGSPTGGKTLMGILSWIVVGAIAGWLAGMLVRGDEGLGVIGKIVLGIVGAVVGGFIAGQLFGGDYINGINFQTIIVATIGAIIVVVGYNALIGRSRTGRGAI
jgi:uncharacterized membrane protein YeaQ/YmgE (transglycosylase-associated protein family)